MISYVSNADALICYTRDWCCHVGEVNWLINLLPACNNRHANNATPFFTNFAEAIRLLQLQIN